MSRTPCRWLAAGCLAALMLFDAGGQAAAPRYLDPVAIAPDAGRERAYVALAGTSAVAVVDLRTGTLAATWAQSLAPSGVALSADGRTLAVTLGETEGRVALLRAGDGAVVREFPAGFSPLSPVWIGDGTRLAVCNRFTNTVGFFDPRDGRRHGLVAVTREPCAAVATPDGTRLLVAGGMPTQPADVDFVACAVDVIDVRQARVKTTILLPNGATGVQAITLTPDGRHALVPHVIGHYQVPTNQLERGWMNANALSVIDVQDEQLLGTVLLDDTTLGAANPWGVGVTADSRYLAVASAGTHEVSRIPWAPVLARLREARPATPAKGEYGYGISRDLTIMTKVGRVRIRTGEGPRAVAMLGTRALVAEYFTGRLAVLDLAVENVAAMSPQEINLGVEPAMNDVRRGELRFADAGLCFQQWQSCLSCHPGIRADGLNWDNLNDGLGNPKQTKSMVFSHVTPPAMAHGVRASAEMAVRAGIRFIQFASVDEKQASDIDAYLKSLRPLPSPHLVDGGQSPLALRGREIFQKVGCAECHSGPYFTDLAQHEVAHASPIDGQRAYDTPTLREVWRTAPYLYDGRAVTMEEALRIKNRGVENLSQEEMNALIEYVLSL